MLQLCHELATELELFSCIKSMKPSRWSSTLEYRSGFQRLVEVSVVCGLRSASALDECEPTSRQVLEQEVDRDDIEGLFGDDVDVSNLSRSISARASSFVSSLGNMTSVCLSKHSEATLALETVSNKLQSTMSRQEEALATIFTLLTVC